MITAVVDRSECDLFVTCPNSEFTVYVSIFLDEHRELSNCLVLVDLDLLPLLMPPWLPMRDLLFHRSTDDTVAELKPQGNQMHVTVVILVVDPSQLDLVLKWPILHVALFRPVEVWCFTLFRVDKKLGTGQNRCKLMSIH